MKDFIKEVQKNPVVAGMAFSYLMDKGASMLSAVAADEFSAAIDAQMKEAEANGAFYIVSKETMMDMFHMAKKMAGMDAAELAAVIGHVCYENVFAGAVCGDSTAEKIHCECPKCGNEYFSVEGDSVICTKCNTAFYTPDVKLILYPETEQ